MPTIVEISALYNADAETVFTEALHFDEMTEAMSGLATYVGLPEREVVEGETLVVDITIWKVFKNTGHVMHVEKLDRENRILQSREHNNSLARWDHTLSVQPRGGQAIWLDVVVVDAGWRTHLVALFAAYVYKRRHRHRQALNISRRIKKLG